MAPRGIGGADERSGAQSVGDGTFRAAPRANARPGRALQLPLPTTLARRTAHARQHEDLRDMLAACGSWRRQPGGASFSRTTMTSAASVPNPGRAVAAYQRSRAPRQRSGVGRESGGARQAGRAAAQQPFLGSCAGGPHSANTSSTDGDDGAPRDRVDATLLDAAPDAAPASVADSMASQRRFAGGVPSPNIVRELDAWPANRGRRRSGNRRDATVAHARSAQRRFVRDANQCRAAGRRCDDAPSHRAAPRLEAAPSPATRAPEAASVVGPPRLPLPRGGEWHRRAARLRAGAGRRRTSPGGRPRRWSGRRSRGRTSSSHFATRRVACS